MNGKFSQALAPNRENKSIFVWIEKEPKKTLPREHSSPILSGLKHDSLLWYDDLHQAHDIATISFELNDSFAWID